MPVINKLFGGSVDLMRQALNVRMERQGLIQSNVANYETPGYKVQDLNFDRVMESVMQGQGQLDLTNKQHVQLDALELSKTREFSEEPRPVDLDEEMVKLSTNQLMYQVTTRLVAKKLEGIRYAIDEGGK